MRNWNTWLKPLVKKFQNLENNLITGTELERFFEIEYCLRLRERLMPELPCSEVWSLLTGYSLPNMPDTPLALHMCKIARHRVRFLRTSTAWQRWLTWYAEQPPNLRLYEIDFENDCCQQRVHTSIAPERLEIYDQTLEVPAEHRQRSTRWAGEGEYSFTIKGENYSVHIPTELAQISHPTVPEEPPTPSKRVPIKVCLDELKKVAEVLEQKEPDGNWIERVQNLNFALVEGDQLDPNVLEFTIEKLFHLIGMVGSGKSTLIQVLIYLLVVERDLRVTLMLNTVVESIQMAAKLRQLGIKATPALGTARGTHRLKYGQANTQDLLPEDQFLPDANQDAALEWLTAPCALSGAMTEGGPIPSGYEPCNSLFDTKGKQYACPVRPVCPVHQASQDLVESQVWIVNPASFIQSRAPENLSSAEMRLLEAIYRTSDLLIIDEADRVQVQWDRKYAPVDNLAGHPEALLDWLNVTLAQQFARRGRRPLVHSRNNELSTLANEADRLSNWLMHLLFNDPELVKWVGNRPLTNSVIYNQLANELARPEPAVDPDEAIYQNLQEEFKHFYSNPTAEEGGYLARLVNDPRNVEAGLTQQIEEWLYKEIGLPWSLNAHPQGSMLVRRLELGLLLTAMDKRVDGLLRNWLWAAPEFGERQILDQSPPQEYVDLLPESPLGNLLGYQYVEQKPGGLLKYIQCYGIGRWLLTNFHHLYADLDGIDGPHLFLTSATSWAPGSPQFHLVVPPDAILSSPEEELMAIANSTYDFIPVVNNEGENIRVSGRFGKDRETNLQKLTRYLASPNGDYPSQIDNELQYWKDQGLGRKVLLLVGSYVEARLVVKTMLEIPGWRHRVVSMHPDEDESLDSWLIRRGEIENLYDRQVDVLVAPLLAIQRGFNILDDAGGALLGSAFFLVRPYPVPNDLSQHVTGVNSWAIDQLSRYQNRLPAGYDTNGVSAIRRFRNEAYSHWHHRLGTGKYGMQGLAADMYQELLWDQFVVVWQTIGRLVRRGRSTRIFFVDGAFDQKRGRSMLRGWAEIMAEYLGPNSTKPCLEREFAKTLYNPAYQAFSSLINKLKESNSI